MQKPLRKLNERGDVKTDGENSHILKCIHSSKHNNVYLRYRFPNSAGENGENSKNKDLLHHFMPGKSKARFYKNVIEPEHIAGEHEHGSTIGKCKPEDK